MDLNGLKDSKKILIIGNIACGKTRLARQIHQFLNIPILHVDRIQFDPQLNIQPHPQTIRQIQEFQNQDSWLIDGHGPLDILIQSFEKADTIVFCDYPVWKIYLFLSLRWLKILFGFKRQELPAHSSELQWAHFIKSYRTVKKIDKVMRPQIIQILSRPELKTKVHRIV